MFITSSIHNPNYVRYLCAVKHKPYGIKVKPHNMKKYISKNLSEKITLENLDEVLAIAHAVDFRYRHIKRAFAGDTVPDCYKEDLEVFRKFLVFVYGKVE